MPSRKTLPSRSDFGPAIKTRKLTSDELDTAVAILASGMRDNPIHVQAFGTDPDRRQRRLRPFLSPLLGYVYRRGDVLGAYRDGEMVGVLGMNCARPLPSVSDNGFARRPANCSGQLTDRDVAYQPMAGEVAAE